MAEAVADVGIQGRRVGNVRGGNRPGNRPIQEGLAPNRVILQTGLFDDFRFVHVAAVENYLVFQQTV